MRSREEVGLPIPGHIVDIPAVMKGDDANENHNYIACLLIL